MENLPRAGEVLISEYFSEYGSRFGESSIVERAINSLERANIGTMDQLCAKPVKYIEKIRNVGAKTVELIINLRNKYMGDNGYDLDSVFPDISNPAETSVEKYIEEHGISVTSPFIICEATNAMRDAAVKTMDQFCSKPIRSFHRLYGRSPGVYTLLSYIQYKFIEDNGLPPVPDPAETYIEDYFRGSAPTEVTKNVINKTIARLYVSDINTMELLCSRSIEDIYKIPSLGNKSFEFIARMRNMFAKEKGIDLTRIDAPSVYSIKTYFKSNNLPLFNEKTVNAVINYLESRGINNMEELFSLPLNEFLRFRGLGVKSKKVISYMLEVYVKEKDYR